MKWDVSEIPRNSHVLSYQYSMHSSEESTLWFNKTGPLTYLENIFNRYWSISI